MTHLEPIGILKQLIASDSSSTVPPQATPPNVAIESHSAAREQALKVAVAVSGMVHSDYQEKSTTEYYNSTFCSAFSYILLLFLKNARSNHLRSCCFVSDNSCSQFS
jgi:hypothetical protein